MKHPTVRRVRDADEASAVDTIVLAFAADPVARWTWRVAHDYLAGMPRLVRAFGGNAFAHGTAICTDAGAALWLPPGVHPDDEKMGEVMESTVSDSQRDEGFSLFEQMAKYHPGEPHWYLPLIGVDPAHQGKGHGDALMSHVLAQCDRDGTLAYLESTNPRNISLYLRHGFAVLGTVQAGSSPPITPMLRRPR
ncbi:MAG: GNAT family N-acetyltransferase [Rhizobiales bacterium]|nr:GNAT family N-acetyltransferase [Hyphomicrobiales bacterium]